MKWIAIKCVSICNSVFLRSNLQYILIHYNCIIVTVTHNIELLLIQVVYVKKSHTEVTAVYFNSKCKYYKKI